MSKIKKQTSKIFHVEMRSAYKGHRHYYFGSKAAIYAHIPEKFIGIPLKYMWDKKYTSLFNIGDVYRNEFLTIRIGELQRLKTNRGKLKLTEDEIKKLSDE